MKSPAFADLNPAALTAHGEWTGTRYNVFVSAYNTNLIKRDSLPKSYDDLADPKWKGGLGINPMIGNAGCCARATSGQTAAPPSPAINSRRLIA